MAGTMLPPQGLEQPFSLPLLLSPPSPSFPTPPSRIDRRPPTSHADQRHTMPAAARPPPPFSPLCTPFARKGGARGHVAPGPSLGRTALYRATRPPTPPFPIRVGAHEGTPLRIASAPSRSLFAPPRSREKGARDPRPLPSPSRAEGGRTRARHPQPHSRGRGGAQRHAAPGTSLPPWPRHPVRAGRGTRDSPSPPAPPLPPSTAPPCTRGKGACEGTPPLHPSHSRGRGAHKGLPLAAPLRTRGQGAREAKPPHPVAPHSRGKGRTRPPASLRVAQQDRRRLRVPAFTAPAPRFRAPLYDLDKK
ncbi:hypothetical protein EDB85DRAFT_2197818 [Lactarius pseudohatsudake]|nr:hypothetical protein EDB85DRAFT_2197818 [Lactarius pseudohatsudake]